MPKLANMFISRDQDGLAVPSVMDQYAFVTRNIVDILSGPEYVLSVQPSGSFIIQKHFTNGSGHEDMLYYREEYVTGRNPRTVFNEERESLTYGEFWEVF